MFMALCVAWTLPQLLLARRLSQMFTTSTLFYSMLAYMYIIYIFFHLIDVQTKVVVIYTFRKIVYYTEPITSERFGEELGGAKYQRQIFGFNLWLFLSFVLPI